MGTKMTPAAAAPIRRRHEIDDLRDSVLIFTRDTMYVYALAAHATYCDGERDPSSLYTSVLRSCTVAAEAYFRVLEEEDVRRLFLVQEYTSYGAAVAAVRQHPLWAEDGLDDPRVTVDLFTRGRMYLFESDRAGYLFIVAGDPQPTLAQSHHAPVQTVVSPRLAWASHGLRMEDGIRAAGGRTKRTDRARCGRPRPAAPTWPNPCCCLAARLPPSCPGLRSQPVRAGLTPAVAPARPRRTTRPCSRTTDALDMMHYLPYV